MESVQFILTNENNCRLHSITSERIGNPELKAAIKCVHEYKLVENELTAEDFARLKVATGFMSRSVEQVERALQNGLFNVSAICDGKVVGMGRLVGDGAMYWYLQEIIVLPEYQGKGTGKSIVNRLIEYVRETAIPGTGVEIGLTAVKGKEPFYERFGFSLGSSGMKKWIEIDA